MMLGARRDALRCTCLSRYYFCRTEFNYEDIEKIDD